MSTLSLAAYGCCVLPACVGCMRVVEGIKQKALAPDYVHITSERIHRIQPGRTTMDELKEIFEGDPASILELDPPLHLPDASAAPLDAALLFKDLKIRKIVDRQKDFTITSYEKERDITLFIHMSSGVVVGYLVRHREHSGVGPNMDGWKMGSFLAIQEYPEECVYWYHRTVVRKKSPSRKAKEEMDECWWRPRTASAG